MTELALLSLYFEVALRETIAGNKEATNLKVPALPRFGQGGPNAPLIK